MRTILKGIFKMNCFFGILSLLFLTGCKKDWLEAKSNRSLAVPETVKDYQAMLDNVQINLNPTPGYSEIAADGHYYLESDYNAMATSTNQFNNFYTWTINVPYNSTSLYSIGYSWILNCNIILDEILKSNDPDKVGLEEVKAQALFHRARIFFDLALSFGQPYNSNTVDSDLGIALRLSTDSSEPSKRSTVKQTYNQIISDLIAAKNILPNGSLFLTRASKLSALGMLSRVYLVMGDYVNAFICANEYLKTKSELLDYSTISTSSTTIGINKEVAFLSFLTNGSALTTNYRVDQSLFDSYDNNDLRKKLFFNVGAAGITFKGNYSNSLTEIFAGIATDEIYLIRAEGYARSGNHLAAMKDLNDLLRSRWAKNPDGSTKYIDQIANNEADALRKIFEERKKQLILRNVRWSDLRRLNLDDRFKVTLSRVIGGQTYTIEPSSYKYTFPIPNEILRLSGIQQNPGY